MRRYSGLLVVFLALFGLGGCGSSQNDAAYSGKAFERTAPPPGWDAYQKQQQAEVNAAKGASPKGPPPPAAK
jgi:hypothetical protein